MKHELGAIDLIKNKSSYSHEEIYVNNFFIILDHGISNNDYYRALRLKCM